MSLYLLAFLGGVLTLLSPCILPVLPFVFARADRPFARNGLPLLVGMALVFTVVASVATVGGGWVVQANRYGRAAALLLMGLFALTLLVPRLAERFTRPVLRAGEQLSRVADHRPDGVGSSLLLGVATGLLWAPCAGPILGLVLTGAALNGANLQTSLLLFAYSAGAAASLALALLAGNRVLRAMKASIPVGEGLRRAFGVVLLASVVAIASGLDTATLAGWSSDLTGGVERHLVDSLGRHDPETPGALPVESAPGSFAGATTWLNSPPLSLDPLRGHVVLVDFWTFACINCLHVLPDVKALPAKYAGQGLVVVGVHTPEYPFERELPNVRSAVKDLGITYPVAVDNAYAIWTSFGNELWPAQYLIDAQGRVRHHHFGEGGEKAMDRAVQQLLNEAHADVPAAPSPVPTTQESP